MINWTIQGSEAMVATLRLRASRGKDVQPFLLRAGIMVRDAAVLRIRQGGPGWQPDALSTVEMKGSSSPGIDTGTMMASITVDTSAEPNVAIVGIQGPAANRTTTGGATLANYAYWFQFGTGAYAGHSPWTIIPTTKKVLSWSAGGTTFFARSVFMMGQPPRPFLYIDRPLATRIAALATRWFGGSNDLEVS